MDNYNKLIKELEKKGLEFAEGLTNEEIIYIENLYNITFPKELKDFLKIKLPISNGFYNWRDYTEKNKENINKAINMPLEGLLFDIEYNNFWVETWEKIDEEKIDIKKQEFLKKYQKAPKLIPIYKHRYMPDINKGNIPILSVVQSDIIVYGKNLRDYLEREFILSSKLEDIENNYDIEFWSEVINNY